MNFSRYTIWVQQRPAGKTLPTWTCLRVPLWLPVSRESLDERGHAVHNGEKGRRTKRRAWRRRTTAAKGGGFEDRRGGGVQRRPSKVDAESSMVAARGTTRLNRSTSLSCATCRWPRRRLVKGPCASWRRCEARGPRHRGRRRARKCSRGVRGISPARSVLLALAYGGGLSPAYPARWRPSPHQSGLAPTPGGAPACDGGSLPLAQHPSTHRHGLAANLGHAPACSGPRTGGLTPARRGRAKAHAGTASLPPVSALPPTVVPAPASSLSLARHPSTCWRGHAPCPWQPLT